MMPCAENADDHASRASDASSIAATDGVPVLSIASLHAGATDATALRDPSDMVAVAMLSPPPCSFSYSCTVLWGQSYAGARTLPTERTNSLSREECRGTGTG